MAVLVENSKLLPSVPWTARCTIAVGLRPREIVHRAVHSITGGTFDYSTNRHEITVYYSTNRLEKTVYYTTVVDVNFHWNDVDVPTSRAN